MTTRMKLEGDISHLELSKLTPRQRKNWKCGYCRRKAKKWVMVLDMGAMGGKGEVPCCTYHFNKYWNGRKPEDYPNQPPPAGDYPEQQKFHRARKVDQVD